jgi:peptidoglycan hydrolase CwlO-like protein
MRRIVTIVLILIVALLAYNYFQTGEIRLLPLSAQEEKLMQLEKALEREKRDLRALQREADAVGGATISEVEQKTKEIEQLKTQIADLKAEMGK